LFTSFYKLNSGLNYPPKIWGMEFTVLILFYLLQMMRLDLGARANRNEKKESMQFFTVFTLISIIFYMFFAT